MSYFRPCEICKKRSATDMHHCFSQTGWAKKKYGERLHHSANLQFLCRQCHLTKSVKRLTELEFLEATKDFKKG